MSDRRPPQDLEGHSGRKYAFEHPTEQQLAPGQSFPGVYAMVSLVDDQLCSIKFVAFSNNLPHVARTTHGGYWHKHGATHYLIYEIDSERAAAEIVADLIKIHKPIGNQ